MELLPLKSQHPCGGNWSDARVRIGRKGNGHQRCGVDEEGAAHVDCGGRGPERYIENTLETFLSLKITNRRMRSAGAYHFQCEDRLRLRQRHSEVEVRERRH